VWKKEDTTSDSHAVDCRAGNHHHHHHLLRQVRQQVRTYAHKHTHTQHTKPYNDKILKRVDTDQIGSANNKMRSSSRAVDGQRTALDATVPRRTLYVVPLMVAIILLVFPSRRRSCQRQERSSTGRPAGREGGRELTDGSDHVRRVTSSTSGLIDR